MPSTDALAAQLLEVVRALDPITDAALGSAGGASLAQLAALRCLGTRSLTVVGLADELGNHRSSVSRLVDRLVTQGLAEKTPSAVSGREVTVQATLKGRALARGVAELRLAALAELLAPLGPAERTALAEVLTMLLRLFPGQQANRSTSRSDTAGRARSGDPEPAER